MRCCSIHLVKKMYQVPADMITSTARMVREIQSPFSTMCFRPYGVDWSAALTLAAADASPAGAAGPGGGAGGGGRAGGGGGGGRRPGRRGRRPERRPDRPEQRRAQPAGQRPEQRRSG